MTTAASAGSSTDDEALIDGKDRKFKNVKQWHEDFMARLAALKKDVPGTSNDYKTEMQRLDILKRIADIVRRDRDSKKNVSNSDSRGESTMRDLENRLNDVGRRAEPMRWRSVKCGLKHRNLYTCGGI